MPKISKEQRAKMVAGIKTYHKRKRAEKRKAEKVGEVIERAVEKNPKAAQSRRMYLTYFTFEDGHSVRNFTTLKTFGEFFDIFLSLAQKGTPLEEMRIEVR